MSLQSRHSARFSENPVSATHSPPRTPPGSQMPANVVQTPYRASATSENMTIKVADDMKNVLLQELDGFVTPFDPARLSHLLSNAASDQACREFLLGSGATLYDRERTLTWTKIPQPAKRESHLYKPLIEIIKAVHQHFGLGATRRVFDTHHKNVSTDNSDTLKGKPDILVTGSGVHFRGKINEKLKWYQCLTVFEVKKEVIRRKKKERKRSTQDKESGDESDKDGEDSELDDDSEEEVVDDPEEEEEEEEEEKEDGTAADNEDDLDSGAMPPEEETEEEVHDKYEKKVLSQLAFYARQTLSQQPTRSFMYNVLITERRVRLFLFDRVGAQLSNWIDYHQSPESLIRIICLISSSNLESLGIDTTVTFHHKKIHFSLDHANNPITVSANPIPWIRPNGLRGRATTCWWVTGSDGKSYLLKQQFVREGRTREDEIFDRIQQLENVDLSVLGMCSHAQTYGTVSEARGMCVVPQTFHDRRLYRILLQEHGEPIHKIEGKSSLDVIVALRDAITAHKILWDADILHRDISINNMLYRKASAAYETLRGVLIDFDLSVFIGRDTSNALADFRTGTRAFQSICILESYSRQQGEGAEKRPTLLHEHMDDLESFFWVLVWIVCDQRGPEKDERQLNPNIMVRENLQTVLKHAAVHKRGILADHSSLQLQPGWPSPVTTLARKMAGFLHEFVEKKRAKLSQEHKASTVSELREMAPNDYKTVLGFFDDAIAELYAIKFSASDKKADISAPQVKPSESDASTRATSKRSREADVVEAMPDNDEVAQHEHHQPPPKRPRSAASTPGASDNMPHGLKD
ncbi:hypothetical protein CVT24_008963 [Panaeolus cyanescens]|uniref:Fungal-type protein kinase domain-containing protein n=1 Tax=Panaeolus cyanescens TaxID=181874 RepID=A0A409YAR4_9AGAR|nr:hypothetical protein CVT24_008963 [Panaeolus cyanescens]